MPAVARSSLSFKKCGVWIQIISFNLNNNITFVELKKKIKYDKGASFTTGGPYWKFYNTWPLVKYASRARVIIKKSLLTDSYTINPSSVPMPLRLRYKYCVLPWLSTVLAHNVCLNISTLMKNLLINVKNLKIKSQRMLPFFCNNVFNEDFWKVL